MLGDRDEGAEARAMAESRPDSGLAEANAELAAALALTDRGFFTADKDGLVHVAGQSLVETWLGATSKDTRVWSYLADNSAAKAGELAVAWAAVFEDMLPLELTLDQLPHRVRCGKRTLRLTYRALPTNGVPEKLVVVVADASAEEEREAADAKQHELSLMMRRLVKDTAAVEEFFDEGFALVETIERTSETGDLIRLKRSLHTLKGNSGFFGLVRFAALVHEVESHLVATEGASLGSRLPDLVAAWEEIAITVSPYLGSRCDAVDVSNAELEHLIKAARGGITNEEMVARLTSLRKESVERRLGRLAQQARGVAVDLGKDIEVTTISSGERWERERFSAFWSSTIHVIRNAIDHGFESRDARVAEGKAPRGLLVLRARETDSDMIFEIEDDGGGIDWIKLRTRARESCAHLAAVDDTELLFMDGVSSRDTVTEFSGRGVGLAATRAECVALGGKVSVDSRRGRGTRFSFTFPKEQAESDAPRESGINPAGDERLGSAA
jgi:chemotaxis protein histidine kinase CheA